MTDKSEGVIMSIIYEEIDGRMQAVRLLDAFGNEMPFDVSEWPVLIREEDK